MSSGPQFNSLALEQLIALVVVNAVSLVFGIRNDMDLSMIFATTLIPVLRQ